MPLFLNNRDVEQLLSMKTCMEALEILYRELGEGKAVAAPRSDIHVPTSAERAAEAPMAHYLKTMSGATPHFGTAALRFSSDIVAWRSAGGGMRREKLPTMPGGRWLGLVLLFSSTNGELLAIMNDGVLQRMRVGGANGVATKLLARADRRRRAGRRAGDGGVRGAQHKADQSLQPDPREPGEVRGRDGRRRRRRDRSGRLAGGSGVRCRHRHHVHQRARAVPGSGGAPRRNALKLHAARRGERRRAPALQPARRPYAPDREQRDLLRSQEVRALGLRDQRSSAQARHRLESAADAAGFDGRPDARPATRR